MRRPAGLISIRTGSRIFDFGIVINVHLFLTSKKIITSNPPFPPQKLDGGFLCGPFTLCRRTPEVGVAYTVKMYENNKTLRIDRTDAAYPGRLERLTDPPSCIYVRGAIPDGPSVAIVGSRKADTAAIRYTSRLAADLSSQGIAVISGGALGIDTAAHQGAIEGGGGTVSVIGSGFSYLYPAENKKLFDEVERCGALVTEYHDAQPPTKWTFPKRNRIVAALADVVVVVQAAARSGALITAGQARMIDVPVAAVPGSAGDPRYRGNHNLIRSGATLVDGADDILLLLSSPRKKTQLTLPGVISSDGGRTSSATPTDPVQVKILEILCTRPLHIDDISLACGLLPSEASAAILSLELQGLIEDRGGKNFVRVG